MQAAFDLLHHYGYGGLFVLLFIEMLGVPIPVEAVLAFAGIGWTKGVFSLPPLLLAAYAANLGGATAAYAIGRFAGRRALLAIGGRFGLREKRFEQVERKFEKYSVALLLGSRFLLGFRVFVPYLAGINRLPFARFSMYNALSGIVWVTVYVLFGSTLHRMWQRYNHMPETPERWVIAGGALLLALLLAGWGALCWRRKRRARLGN